MSKKIFAGIISILLVIGVISCKDDKKSVDLRSEVVYLEGKVLINGNDVQVGDTVTKGDIISTDADSVCEITIGSKNIIRLTENSQILFDVEALSANINIIKGKIAAVMNDVSEWPQFTVETESITTGVRGTVFFLGYDDEESVYTCICNGRVNYLPKGETDQIEVSAAHHSGNRFILKNGTVEMTKADMLYHTDDTLENRAKKINSTIDWSKIDN